MLNVITLFSGYDSQCLANEQWRDVPNYEGLYQVSNLGRIRRMPKGKIRVQKAAKNGYLQVNLCKNNKVRWISVHRLVASAFIANPDNLPVVNHKDENKHNNHADNLEWVTPRENCLHGTGTTRQKESRRRNDPEGNSWKNAAKKLAIGCCRYNKTDNSIVKTYASLTEAAHDSGINITTILNQCKGKTQSRTSTYWRYAEN
jgi:hypothetical protein